MCVPCMWKTTFCHRWLVPLDILGDHELPSTSHLQLSSTCPVEGEPVDTGKIRNTANDNFLHISLHFTNKNQGALNKCRIMICFNCSKAPREAADSLQVQGLWPLELFVSEP